YDWIESRVPGGHGSPFGRFLDVAYNEEYGADTSVQSALNIVYLLGFQPDSGPFAIFGESDERYHIAGGNERLPAAIAGAPPRGTVKLGWALKSIARNRDRTVTLGFNGGRSVTVDHAVLAMHFAVLRTLDYSQAGFDSLKKTAIAQLGAGRNVKLQLQFDSR